MTNPISKIIYVIFIVEMKKGLKKPMNKQDKQDLELILYRLNEQDKSVQKLEKHFNKKFNEIHDDISFIKENLFNPNEGNYVGNQTKHTI